MPIAQAIASRQHRRMQGQNMNMAPSDRASIPQFDILSDRIAALRDLIPEAFTEDKIDFAELRAALGDFVDTRPERYAFTWAGRTDAQKSLQAPASSTLVPSEKESVNWETTKNVFIEGDNLEVLKLLYKAYRGKVRTIYIDPPYNSGNDYIYNDDFRDPIQPYLALTGQLSEGGSLASSRHDISGRLHSSWLSMMYPRLWLARQLLRDDGAIFVSIDDREVGNLKALLNEIFGEENLISQIVWQKKVSPANDAKWFSSDHEYILLYAKSATHWTPTRLKRTAAQEAYYRNPDNDARGVWNSATYTCNKSRAERPNLYYSIENPNTGVHVFPSESAVWAYSFEQHQKHAEEKRIYWGVDGKSNTPRLKNFLSEARDVVPRSLWKYEEVGHTQEATKELMDLFGEKIFDTPKPTRLLERVISISTDDTSEDLIMDFFAGSGTLAGAVLRQNISIGRNHRFIVVQLPEPTGRIDYPTIADIAKERIRRVIGRLESHSMVLNHSGHDITDLGFRVFTMGNSCLKSWSGTSSLNPEDYFRQLSAFADPFLTESFDPQTVVWEIAIKEGFSLTSKVTITPMAGYLVYRVDDPETDLALHVCLSSGVVGDDALSIVNELNLTQKDIFYVRDDALSDTAAANLVLQCRLKVI